ncbi:hypothetical protein B0T18DRAFT_385764 [Schizothecium vesticola]|uniref:Uncharacterized protein n=1 Tax=Schizothecium vesticola TaxID=314040 RepID=A0AA40F9Z5_9PEZI|nr:hypothetical protein B0T18DRAFT_385764 [Schizothecium vesticola]
MKFLPTTIGLVLLGVASAIPQDFAEKSQQKINDCSRYLDGEDEYGNSVPESLEIDSDEVSPKALAELAMAAVRITQRHRDFLGNMAGLEEAARRVLKSACVEGNLVAPQPDPEEIFDAELQAYRRGPAPAFAPAPKPAAPASAPTGRKMRIGKEKISSAAAAAVTPGWYYALSFIVEDPKDARINGWRRLVPFLSEMNIGELDNATNYDRKTSDPRWELILEAVLYEVEQELLIIAAAPNKGLSSVILSGVTEGSRAHGEQRGGKMIWSASSNISRYNDDEAILKPRIIQYYPYTSEISRALARTLLRQKLL